MKVLNNYIYNLSYQIISIILPFATIPYVSRVLGTEGIGISSYVNSIITYFVLLSNLGIAIYGNRSIAYAKDSLLDRSTVFWELMVIKTVMFFLSIVIFLIFIQFNNYYEFLKVQIIYLFASLLDISWLFIGLEEFKKLAIRNILIKLLSFFLIFLFVVNHDDIYIYLLILSGSSLLGNLTLWFDIKKYTTLVSFKKININLHIKGILILFLPQLVSYIFMGVNKLMLPNLSSISEAGLFDNADKTVRLLLTLVVAIGTVMFPRMAAFFKTGNKDELFSSLKITFDITTLITFPIVAGVILISTPFSILFFGEKFNGINVILSILIIELIFMGWSSLIGNQFFIAIKKEKILLISMSISLIFMGGFSYLLIPKLGALGAVISSLIGEIIIFFVQLYYLSKSINIRELFSDTYKFLISSTFMFIICFNIQSLIVDKDNLVKILITVIIGAVSYLIFVWLLSPDLKYIILNRIRKIEK